MFKVNVLLLLVASTVRCSNDSVKCCELDFDEDGTSSERNDTAIDDPSSVRNETVPICTSYSKRDEEVGCRRDDLTNEDAYGDTGPNGTTLTQMCPHDRKNGTNCECDSVFTPLNFWGASIVVFANLVYLFPYLIVVLFYIFLPGLRKRAYDRAVFCHNANQLLIAVVLTGMGYFVLCHKYIDRVYLIPLGLSLMFLAQSATFWMFFICFDMTLMITRFRWMPPSDAKGRNEHRKFLMYAAYAWGLPFAATAFACIMELCPFVPKSSPLKPNYERFGNGVNLAVILHTCLLPLIPLVITNALFVYTTYKIVQIRKSTAIATENRKKNMTKKYFFFLKLYLLMDSPWIVAVMASAFTDLWILKFMRMVQPILMLLAMLPKKKLYQSINCCKGPLDKRGKQETAAKCTLSKKNGFVSYI